MHDSSKWHMVLDSNPIIDDILNLPVVGCCGTINTLRFGSSWRVLRALVLEGFSIIKKKDTYSHEDAQIEEVTRSTSTITFLVISKIWKNIYLLVTS